MEGKSCRTVLMLVTVVGLLVACKQPTPETIVNTVEVTRVVQREPERIVATVIVTAVPSTTPPPAMASDKYVTMIDEEISIEGVAPINFKFTHSNDPVIKETMSKYGVSGYSFNENNPTAKEQLYRLIMGGLWQTYLVQNPDSEVTFEDFLDTLDEREIELYTIETRGTDEPEVINLGELREVQSNQTRGAERELSGIRGAWNQMEVGYEWEEKEGRLVLHHKFYEGDLAEADSVYSYHKGKIDPSTKPYYLGNRAQRLRGCLEIMSYFNLTFDVTYTADELYSIHVEVRDVLRDMSGEHYDVINNPPFDKDGNDLITTFYRVHTIFQADMS